MSEGSERDGRWASYPLALRVEHAGLLDASAVPVHVAARRGVRSITTKKEAHELGLTGLAQRPGLWFPRWTTRGDNHGGQLRADQPRLDDNGRTVKYETPRKQPAELDVHPDSRALLRDPAVPLIVTEGVRKADSCWGVFQIPAVSLAGVWSWRGTDIATGGVLALASWDDIALRSGDDPRTVLVTFDSDVMVKRQVLAACARLGAFLEARGAAVFYVVLPDGPNGTKTGLDDFIAGGARWADIQRLAVDELPGSTTAGAGDSVEEEDTFDDVANEGGAGVLDDLSRFVKRFVVLGAPDHEWALALWALHTWTLAAFPISPRLNLTSPEKRSGKSRAVEVLSCLCRRPEMVVLPTASAIFRLTELETPTWCLDEMDNQLAAGEEARAALMAVVNSGYRKGATVPRTEKQGETFVVVRFRIFAPVALAGIGDLPDTTADRSIVIPMTRKLSSERTERFHIERSYAEAAGLRRRCEAWAKRHHDVLAKADPAIPESLDDRAAEIWGPLLAISEQAGGEWPDRAWAAAEQLSGPDRESSESPGIRLLADLRVLWHDPGNKWEERVPTHSILSKLWGVDESDWNRCQGGLPLDANGLARLLRRFGVRSTKQRMGEDSDSLRGYLRSDLEPVWARYLPPTDPTRNSRDTRNNGQTSWPADMRDVPADPSVPPPDAGSESFAPADADPLRWGPRGEVDL